MILAYIPKRVVSAMQIDAINALSYCELIQLGCQSISIVNFCLLCSFCPGEGLHCSTSTCNWPTSILTNIGEWFEVLSGWYRTPASVVAFKTCWFLTKWSMVEIEQLLLLRNWWVKSTACTLLLEVSQKMFRFRSSKWFLIFVNLVFLEKWQFISPAMSTLRQSALWIVLVMSARAPSSSVSSKSFVLGSQGKYELIMRIVPLGKENFR